MGNSKLTNLLTSLAVVAAVFFCSTPVSAETFNEGGLFYNVLNDSEVEVTQAPDVFYYIRDVVIPETVTHDGKTYTVTAVGEKAFEYCRYLTSIKFNNNITEIGNGAFSGCEELTSVKFPPSLLKIGNYAFGSCTKLADIQTSGNVEFAGSYPFGNISYNPIPLLKNQPDGPVYVDKVFLGYKGNCPKNLSIKEGTVCICGHALDSREYLETVNLPSSLKVIGEFAFAYCKNFGNLNFANEEKLEYVGRYAFISTAWSEILPIKPIYLGKVFYKYHVDTDVNNYTIKDGTVMIADNAFTNGVLKSISIPNSVKIIKEEAFFNLRNLKSIVLPEGLKELESSVFSNCISLESVKLPSSLEILNTSAFEGCRSLKQLDLPANLKEFIGTGFKRCSSLSKITVDEGNTNFCTEDGILFSKDKKTLISFPATREGDYRVPDFVEKIRGGAFSRVNLKSVTVPASVYAVGFSAFVESQSLESVTFEPHSRVKVLPDHSFYFCQNLKTIVLPDSLEEIHLSVFGNCTALENIQFPETLKYMFEWGNDENKWYKNQPDGIVYAGKLAFKIKGSLSGTTLTVKEGTKAINNGFGQNLAITELILPESLERIGSDAFFNCGNLAVVKGGLNAITEGNVFKYSKWEQDLTDINGAYIFGKNVIDLLASNTNIKIEEGIKNLSSTFYFDSLDKNGILTLDLPGSLKYIQQNTFLNYEVTDTMTVKNIVPVDITGAGISLKMYDNCVLRVPGDLVDTYRNARGWNVFKNIYGDPELSGVETVDKADDAVRVFADGDNIVVEGVEEGTPVEVFNLNGQTVYRGVETMISVPARGIYLVRINGKVFKVTM